jgi:tetratricopeptide (TPR) repeat protein
MKLRFLVALCAFLFSATLLSNAQSVANKQRKDEYTPKQRRPIVWTLTNEDSLNAEPPTRYMRVSRGYDRIWDQPDAVVARQCQRNSRSRGAGASKADRIYALAEALRRRGATDSFRKAIERYGAAAQLYDADGEKSKEAICLTWAGFLSRNLEENQQALKYYEKALAIFRVVGDRVREAAAAKSLAEIYYNLGEMEKALDYYNVERSLRDAIEDHGEKTRAHNDIGTSHQADMELRKHL